MADQPIAFSSDQYDGLITQLGTLITNLQKVETTGTVLFNDDVRLQPKGQTWGPAMSLVVAGQSFFQAAHSVMDRALLPELVELHQGLFNAKSLFQNAEDLALISSADFISEFPV